MGYKSRVSINKIEKGRPVSQKLIVRLAEALDVAPAYLMGWAENPEEQAEFEASVLTDDDTLELVYDYQCLNNEQKKAVKQMIKALLSSTQQ
jgi:transcriptional regulator with XRE-family HTH domain